VVEFKHPFSDQIDLDLVVEQLVETIYQQKNRLVELVESLSAWLSLLNQQNRGFPQLSQLISSRIEDLIDSGRSSCLEVGYHFFTMCWFLWGNQFKDRNDLRNPTIFRDIETVTQSIVSRFQPQDLEVLCQNRTDGGSSYPLITCFSGWLASLGLYSLQLKSEPFWGLLENEIPCLSDLGRRLTEQPIDPSRFTSLSPALLYIWSGKYQLAIDYMSDVESQNLEFVCHSFIHSKLLSHVGKLPELVNLYRKILVESESVSIRNFYQIRIEKIESCPRSIQNNFGYRKFERYMTDFSTYNPNQEVIIVDSADLAESFMMGDLLEMSEIRCRIIDGIILDNLSDLPNEGRFIIIGKGHYNRMIDLATPHLSEMDLGKIVLGFTRPPHFGWYDFNIEERKLVWITGGWEEKTKEGIIKWIKSEEGKKFLMN